MKKMIVLFTMLISLNLFAQDKIDPNPLQAIDTAMSIRAVAGNSFLRCWNWGSPGKNLDSALLMNSSHDFNTSTSNNASGMKVISVIPNINSARNSNYTFNGMCIFLSPMIKPDSTVAFKPRFGDKTGSVFGFNYRNFSIGDTSTDSQRFTLNQAGITSPVKVLDSIWNSNILHYLDYDGDHHKQNNFLGITNDTTLFS